MADFHGLVETIQGELQDALAAVDSLEVARLRQAILQAPRVFVTGKGRTGLQMRAFAMRLAHLGLPVYVVGEVTTPSIGNDDLLLIGSGSGRTASLVEYAARAQKLGAKVALFTTADKAPILDQANYQVRIPTPTPRQGNFAVSRSIQPMGSLFEGALGLLLDAVVLQLMDDLGVSVEQMVARHANLE